MYINSCFEIDGNTSWRHFLKLLILLKINKIENSKIILEKINEFDKNMYLFAKGYYNYYVNKSKDKNNTEFLMLKYINYYKKNVLESDFIYTMGISFFANIFSSYYENLKQYNNAILYIFLFTFNKFFLFLIISGL